MAATSTLPLPGRRTAPATRRSLAPWFACASLLAGCALLPKPAPQVAPLLRARVVPGPATVAWSRDGATLAAVRPGGVALLDAARGSERWIAAPGAVAVDWAPSSSLLVTERTAEGGRVVSVDPSTGDARPLFAAPGVVAARWLRDGASWIAVSATQATGRIGTRSSRALTADLGRGPVELLREEQVLPTRSPPADPARGWAAARPNPVRHDLLLPAFHAPPALAPYTALVEIDPFDPAPEERIRLELTGFSADTCWSPDGGRLALVAADGVLRILEGDRAAAAPAAAPRGAHPSWHPTAELLFLGGWLVTPTGAPVRRLLAGTEDAVGSWSPDGDRLAVSVRGELFVFAAAPAEAPRAAGLRATGDALWELGALKRDGLLLPGPYRERRERLWKKGAEER